MFSIRRWIAAKMFAQQAVAANATGRHNNGFHRLFPSSSNSSSSRNYVPSNTASLIQFYVADEELNMIAAELDSFDGRRDPVRCTNLVNQLRSAQDKVICILFRLMDEFNCERACRDYRSKFPDDLLAGGDNGESLNGQIWFGAECLAAGSNIMNHETESDLLRPMAKILTNSLDLLRQELRQCCSDIDDNFFVYKDMISLELIAKMEQFDRLFASFEFEYVKAMLPIKTVEDIEKQQELTVLFSETVARAIRIGLISQEDIDERLPSVMITIPRLAIVYALTHCGEENPIYKKRKDNLSSVFAPLHSVIHRVYDLLHILRPVEVDLLEKLLANEGIENFSNNYDYLTKEDANGETVLSKRRHSDSECDKETERENVKLTRKLISKRCASTLSLMNILTALGENKVKDPSANRSCKETADTVSVSSVATSTTASTVDSFELALAMGAKNSEYISTGTKHMLHRLFITVAGIADQLQTNYASDLRAILRNVFNLYSTNCCDSDTESVEEALEAQEELLSFSSSSSSSSSSSATTPTTTNVNFTLPDGSSLTPLVESSVRDPTVSSNNHNDANNLDSVLNDPNSMLPPIWVPDELVSVCTACSQQFTLLRRRHHCRNCGQIYCRNCANNFSPLIHYGFTKPVRICNLCFFQ